jgi:hypothetical protein
MAGWQCHFGWNNFFFLSLPSLSSNTTTADNNIHTRISGSKHKKMRFSLSLFSFTLFYFSLYSAATPVASAAVFLENDITKRRREVCWFWLLRHSKQQSIDLLVIIDYYSVYLFFFSLFFLSTTFICTHTLVRLYLSLPHVSRTCAYMYKWSE